MRCPFNVHNGMEKTWNPIYIDFCENFLPAVVGKRLWDDVKKQHLISDIATEADEAFALVIFENNETRWHQIYEDDMKKLRAEESKKKKSEKKKGRKKGTVIPPPLYTNGGSTSNKNGGNRMYNGWSNKGTSRFNEIVAKVLENRASEYAKPFEEYFRQKQIDDYNKKFPDRNKNEDESSKNYVKAYDCLGCPRKVKRSEKYSKFDLVEDATHIASTMSSTHDGILGEIRNEIPNDTVYRNKGEEETSDESSDSDSTSDED